MKKIYIVTLLLMIACTINASRVCCMEPPPCTNGQSDSLDLHTIEDRRQIFGYYLSDEFLIETLAQSLNAYRYSTNGYLKALLNKELTFASIKGYIHAPCSEEGFDLKTMRQTLIMVIDNIIAHFKSWPEPPTEFN